MAIPARQRQLGDRVPVGGGVHGVVEGGGEAEGAGGGRRVERERRPGDGPSPEQADIGPTAGVLELATSLARPKPWAASWNAQCTGWAGWR